MCLKRSHNETICFSVIRYPAFRGVMSFFISCIPFSRRKYFVHKKNKLLRRSDPISERVSKVKFYSLSEAKKESDLTIGS